MSLKLIKNSMESYLVTNVTDVAVKRANSSYYTLNGAALTQAQIDALEVFIEPKLVPISQDRTVYSSPKPFDYRAFFQIDIYIKEANGMGEMFDISDGLDALFVEHIENEIVCESSGVINSFVSNPWVITPYRVTCSLMA